MQKPELVANKITWRERGDLCTKIENAQKKNRWIITYYPVSKKVIESDQKKNPITSTLICKKPHVFAFRRSPINNNIINRCKPNKKVLNRYFSNLHEHSFHQLTEFCSAVFPKCNFFQSRLFSSGFWVDTRYILLLYIEKEGNLWCWLFADTN